MSNIHPHCPLVVENFMNSVIKGDIAKVSYKVCLYTIDIPAELDIKQIEFDKESEYLCGQIQCMITSCV